MLHSAMIHGRASEDLELVIIDGTACGDVNPREEEYGTDAVDNRLR